ncbi:hypothetical protein E2C01_098563 [Portunus trituberculatus]|uniref:Uncharacterized protein n=1 Tax=Portunus trituberculatus TaxID=210409 RepID=A0A5B7K8K8_PORTR|nr:hypothetical protein [Portunus trituberculatus]
MAGSGLRVSGGCRTVFLEGGGGPRSLPRLPAADGCLCFGGRPLRLPLHLSSSIPAVFLLPLPSLPSFPPFYH